MPPLWKIRRELLRLAYAPFRGTAELARMVVVRRYCDKVQARKIVSHTGAQPLQR